MSTKVIVVGGGLSGLSAAHTAIEHGAQVILFDKMKFLGGNSTKATSGINGALTKTQIAKGIPDDPKIFEADIVKSSHLGKSDKWYPLAGVLAYGSAPAIEWLQTKFNVDLSLVSRLGSHTHERTHRGKEKFPGMTITYALLEKLEEIEEKSSGKTVKIISDAQVTNVTTDKSGAITGVVYTKGGKEYKEEGVVILASGGFGADFSDSSLLKKYRPDLAHLPTTNGSHNTGDGIKIANNVGADLVDMEWIQVHPTGLVHPKDPDNKVKWLAAEALRGVGGLILDKHGKRFCDELGRRDYVSGEMAKNEGPFRLILNGSASTEINWHCQHYVGRGLMKKINNGKELAAEFGISPEVLEKTFNDYNEVAKNKNCPWGKKYFHNVPFKMDDFFHVAIVTPVVHYTMGGIKISPEAEVVTAADKPIPGLFAAGEVTGGVQGKNRLGGNGLLEAVVLGRVSGASAAKYLLQGNVEVLKRHKLVNNPLSNRINIMKNQLNAELPEYTLEDVAKRNTEGATWVVLWDKVYDVTEFKNDHPGGRDSIMLYAGQDATEQFDMMHSAAVLKKYGPKLEVGRLVKNKTSVPELVKLTPGTIESRTCGGTAQTLPDERAKASFSPKEMIDFMNGGEANTKRRKFIESVVSRDPEGYHKKYNYTREQHVAESVKDFVAYHKPYANFKPTRMDFVFMSECATGGGSLNNSHSIFLTTILGQGTEEQAKVWATKTLRFEICGTYAQTELGHGSNVRGLSTTATYDKNTQEFVLNTPTLQSIKWWPGCLGKVGTHAVVYAQTLIDGKEYGLNVFVLQLRDENHLPLPGIKLGDLGTKVGDHGNDTGYMVLDNVRIPREYMLARFRHVTPEGQYVDTLAKDSKVHYTTMMVTRAAMVGSAGSRIAQAATIAIRYSAVRKQGFVSTKSGISYKSEEHQIIDHKIQQYRLFKWLAHAYAIKNSALWMMDQISEMEGNQLGQIKNTDGLKELAAASGGLKALTSYLATLGIEDLRKCCGGNGYLLHSGIAAIACDYLWQVTAEGDYIILTLLTSRFLLKSVGKAFLGKKLKGIVEYFNEISNPDFDLEKVYPGQASDSSSFMSVDYIERLFRYRSLKLNIEVAQKFGEEVQGKGRKSEEVWNELSIELLTASFVHSYYLLVSNFRDRIAKAPTEALKRVLTRLLCLFACTNILDDNWGDILEGGQFKLARQAAYQLMSEIRPDSIALVDSFDYADYILKSSIGRYDGNVYEALFDAAQKSTLNQKDPFIGYEEYLKPHLNKELLRHGNKVIPKGKF